MRLLIIDIETRPNLAWVWGLWQQNVAINQIQESGSVICFAAKWHGDKRVMFHSDHHDGHDGMLKAAWELMDEADAIIHFNGRAFDIKHLNREFLLAGMPPPSPHVDIDLLATVRQRFKFPSNKLQYISESLGIGSKVHHDGFDLWVRCMAGEDKAWSQMKKYNVQDVRLTEEAYDILLPWITTHPNVSLYDSRPDACPKCGGTNHHRRGVRHTSSQSYRQYQCNNCNSYFRERTRIKRASPNHK